MATQKLSQLNDSFNSATFKIAMDDCIELYFDKGLWRLV